jgi:hypothetical protein
MIFKEENMRRIPIALGLFLMLIGQSWAGVPYRGTSIVEENNLWIGPEIKSAKGIDDIQFNAIIDKAYKLYAPVVESQGGKLVFERNWDDGTVNAYADQQGDDWIVSMFGGLARHEVVTADGFNLVVCHELAHHLGGAPKMKYWFGMTSWASIEGQSDYAGVLKCMRQMWDDEDNEGIVAGMEVHPLVKEKCQEVYADNPKGAAICMRSAMAGDALGKLFAFLREEESPPQFDTPDQNVVERMMTTHPESQCRLDTYFAAALCNVGFAEALDNRDPDKGVCSTANGHTVGVRPLCWYKP